MPRYRHHRRSRAGPILLAVGLIGAAAAAAYLYLSDGRLGQKLPLAPVPSTPPGVPEEAAVPQPAEVPERLREPLDEPQPVEPVEPLPPLAESDAVVRAALETLFGKEAIARYLIPQDLVGRFVATIDNLPNPKIALKLRPLQLPDGAARARPNPAASGRAVLGEEHFARYVPLVRLVEATSADQLEALYLRFSPLLQQAYEDLGYPGQSFDDRVLEVIDHLLQTPEVSAPIAVVRPKYYYEFADPSLEERSAGQKLLMRMGPRNAAIVKARLRELRQRLR